ncbi:aa3-type cytochrome c oxidase subunit IV [Pedomonas mirosovicensis]|nr:aa3-type cytochrome c oxidase subunit IV [Pedomonas mirosovicensis]MCH8684727.1 aa3-type cytochrome c oxidase subunit IV [Pedomonas mirosovicensis]
MAESNFDFRDHKRTYEGFLGMTKYMTIAVVLILIGMAVFLVN